MHDALDNPVAAVLNSNSGGGRSAKRLRDILQDSKLKDVTLETIREALAATGIRTVGVKTAVWQTIETAETAAALPTSVAVDSPDGRWAQFCNNLISTVRDSANTATATTSSSSSSSISAAAFPSSWRKSSSNSSSNLSAKFGVSNSTTELNAASFVLSEATKFLRAEGRLQKLMRTDGEAARAVILEAKEEAKQAREALSVAEQKTADLREEIRRLQADVATANERIVQLQDARHHLQLGIARTAAKVLGAVVVAENDDHDDNSNNNQDMSPPDQAGPQQEQNVFSRATSSVFSRASSVAAQQQQEQQRGQKKRQKALSISVMQSDPEYYLTFLEGIAAEANQLRLEMDAALFIGTQQTEWAIKEGHEAERIVNRLQTAKEQLSDCSTHMLVMRTHISRLEQQLGPLHDREYDLQTVGHALRYHDNHLWSSFAFGGLNGAHADGLEFAVRVFLRTATQCQGRVSVSGLPESEFSILDTATQRHNASLATSSVIGIQIPSGVALNMSASMAFGNLSMIGAASMSMAGGVASIMNAGTSTIGGGGGGGGAATVTSTNLTVAAILSATSAARDAYAVLPQQLLGGGITMLQLQQGIVLAHRKLQQGNGIAIESQAVLAQARDILSRFASWPEGRVHPAAMSPTAVYDGLLRSVIAGSSASFPNYVPPSSSPSKVRMRVAVEYTYALLAAIQREGMCGFSECFLVHAVAAGQAPIGALRALPRLAERLFVRLQSSIGTVARTAVAVTAGVSPSLGDAGGPAAGGAIGAAGTAAGAAPVSQAVPKRKAGGPSVVQRDVFLRTVRDMFPRAAEASILALALVTFAAQEKLSADLAYQPYFKDKEHAGPGMVLTAIYRVALDEQRRVLEELQMAVAQAAWRRFLALKDSEDELVEDEVDSSSAGSSTVPTARSGTEGLTGRSSASGSAAAAVAAATQQQQNSDNSNSSGRKPGAKKATMTTGSNKASTAAQTLNLTENPYSDQALVSLRDFGIAIFQVNPHCSHREMAKLLSVASGDQTIEVDYMTRMRTNASARLAGASSGLAKQPIEMSALAKMVRVEEAFKKIRATMFLEMYDRLSVDAEE